MPAPISKQPIVIVGAGFAGIWLAKALISTLPLDQELIIIERSSHFAYLYGLPRFSVLQNDEYAEKLFVPYDNLFKENSKTVDQVGLFKADTVESIEKRKVSAEILHGQVISIDPESNKIEIRQDSQEPLQLSFSYLVICTGASINISGWESNRLTVQQGSSWLKSLQRRIANSQRIAIIGGGAYGVQIASDIADLYGNSKSVTLIQSRNILLPQYHRNVHDAILPILQNTLGVDVLLNARALSIDGHDIYQDNGEMHGSRRVILSTGQSLEVDLVIKCTGTTPNSEFLPSLVRFATHFNQIPVSKTLQVFREISESSDIQSTPLVHSNIYAIGDVSATGAHKLAGNAAKQATIVAHNIIESLTSKEPNLQEYNLDSSAVKLTLGIKRLVTFETSAHKAPVVSISETSGREDVWLDWIWQELGHQ